MGSNGVAQPVERTSWGHSEGPVSVNAFYEVHKNSLFVPAGSPSRSNPQHCKRCAHSLDDSLDARLCLWTDCARVRGRERSFPCPRARTVVRVLAALLQAPFVSTRRAATYGALGGLLAHEMNHGFDDTGRLFGPSLSMRSWWDDDVVGNYTERTACLGRRCALVRDVRTLRLNARQRAHGARRTHARTHTRPRRLLHARVHARTHALTHKHTHAQR